MPKKTKKEKIIAEYRKRLETVKTETSPNTKYQLPNTNYSPAKATITLPIQNNSYIMKDLKKTFLLAILAIGIEFGIYFFTKGGV